MPTILRSLPPILLTATVMSCGAPRSSMLRPVNVQASAVSAAGISQVAESEEAKAKKLISKAAEEERTRINNLKGLSGAERTAMNGFVDETELKLTLLTDDETLVSAMNADESGVVKREFSSATRRETYKRGDFSWQVLAGAELSEANSSFAELSPYVRFLGDTA